MCLCDVPPPAPFVKGGGFAVGKIGGIVRNNYVFASPNPSVSHTLDSSLYKGASPINHNLNVHL